jgi:phage-related protein
MQDLTEHAITLRGIYAMFPNNSVDVAGMTDAIAETIELGVVTGTLADALNWVGINEDAFNIKLEETNSKAERSALIWDTLNGAYYDAGMLYQQNAAGLNALQWEEMRLLHTKALLGDKLAYTQAAFTNLARVLLEALSPAIIAIGNLLASLANFLSMVISKISHAINSLFGIDGNAAFDNFMSRFGGVNDQASAFNSSLNGALSATNGIGDGLKAATKGAKGLAKGIKDATKEANKLNRTTEAFDELIKAKAKKTNEEQTTPSTPSTGGGGGGATITPGTGGDYNIDVGVNGTEEAEGILDKFGKKVKAIYDEYIKPFVDDIKAIGKAIYDAIEPHIGPIIDGFKKLGKGIAKVVGGSIKIIQGLFRIITGFLTGDADKVYDGVSTIGEGFTEIGEGATDAFGGAAQVIKEFKQALDGGFATIFGNIADTFGQMFEDLSKKFEESAIGKFILGAKDKFFEIVANVKDAPGTAREAISNAWEKIKDKGAELLGNVKEGAGSVREKLGDAWDKIVSKASTLTGKFSNPTFSIGDKLKSAWKTIKTKGATLKGYFSNKNPGTRKTLMQTWDKIKTKGATLTATFRNFFSGPLRAAWNGIARGINSGISIINRIPGVNIGRVPYLAKGGITTGSTLAHIGEGGFREAVLPLERNTEWMSDLADKISERSGAGGPANIILMIDGHELGRATINSINDITQQTGKLQLTFA